MTPQQLKSSILQRAIEGRLVEQRAEEGTAGELIKEIRAEKEKMIKEGKIKKGRPLPPITEEEKPFDIPEGWEWVRFDEFGVYKKGPFGSALTKSMFVPKGIDTVKVYEQKNAIQKDATIGTYYISKQYYEEHMTGFEVEAGDIIVSCAGTIGETYILPDNCEKGIINQALMRMKLMPSVYVSFFLLYFDSILKITARKNSKGSALKNIPPFAELKSYLVPLPPIAEQRRIVAKIEELLPLIDRYEKVYTKLTKLNTRFPEAMKKSLLQYAIQGKLVEQRQDEGTAEDLIKKIQAEKKRLIAERKIKKTKSLPPITDEEKPFDIPDEWEWVRLGDIGDWGSGATPKRHHPEYYGGNIPWLKTGDLNDGYISEIPEFITQEGFENSSVRLNPVGSVLMAMYGATIGKLGILTIPATTNQACCACMPFVNLESKFLFYYLMSQRTNFIKLGEGGAQPNISKEKIVNFVFPLPPLAEQHRIVAKLDELLPFCEQLNKFAGKA